MKQVIICQSIYQLIIQYEFNVITIAKSFECPGHSMQYPYAKRETLADSRKVWVGRGEKSIRALYTGRWNFRCLYHHSYY